MRELWSSLKEGLNAWSGVMAAIALIASPLGAVIAWAFGQQNIAEYLIAAGIAVLLAAPLVAGATVLMVRRMPWRGYSIRRVRRVYEFDRDDPTLQRATWERTIVLLNSAVKVIDFKYQWTGRGTRDDPTVEPLSCGVLQTDPLDTDNHHLVFLGSGFPCREPQSVILRQTFHDPEFTMKTFMGMRATRRFESLCQVVKFSPSRLPRQGSLFYVVFDIRTEKCISRNPIDLQYDDSGNPFVEAEEERPRANLGYKIEWAW
jgi:hypothetical protein